jgi:hypothetical protein
MLRSSNFGWINSEGGKEGRDSWGKAEIGKAESRNGKAGMRDET